MVESIFFRNLTTKGLTAINSGERYFEGYLTVQVKDKQGEVTIVDELMKVLPIWIDRGAPISDTHSNRIIGKGINYSKVVYKDTDGEEYPAIKITGKIHKNYELDNDIWQKIKSGQYKGLSFGGATKADREPMRMKDGSIAYSLKDLEHYEVAVCADPAVPLALITEFNTLAKAAVDGVDLGGGRMLIKCDKFGCYVDKTTPTEEEMENTKSKRERIYETTTLYPHGEKPEPDKRTHAQRVEDYHTSKYGEGWDCPWCEGEAKNFTMLMPDEKDEAAMKKYKEHKDSTHKYRSVGGHQKKKDNSEAGLKAPEARNEALVYDDKTHDQPSETPLENQAKIKKGQKEEGEGTRQRVEEYEAVGRHAEGKPKGVRDVAVAKPDDERPKNTPVGQKQIRHEVADEKGYRGKTHKLEHAKELIDDHIEEMKKGEDWSNADGDRHGMYNQDTDEGGMGKKHTGVKGCKCGDPKCKDPKCKKREVGTGYGAEQNDTGEVHWSGSGSPYPKKKGYSDEVKEGDVDWDQQSNEKRAKPGKKKKKKAIITNIHSRLKSLEFLLMAEKIRGYSPIRNEVDDAAGEKDKPSKEQQTHNTPNPPKKYITEEEKPNNPYESVRVEREEPDDRLGGKKINEVKLLESQDKKVKRKLKNLDFLLRGVCTSCGQKTPSPQAKERETRDSLEQSHAGQSTLAREHPEADATRISAYRSRGARTGTPHRRIPLSVTRNPKSGVGVTGIVEEDKYESIVGRGGKKIRHNPRFSVGTPPTGKRRRGGTTGEELREGIADPTKRKSIITNIYSRLKSLDFLLRDGEFGGMNTGEVEWTEPRDTANSRKKRDKDVA